MAENDFSKLLVIPDGILVHNIPDCNQNKSDEAGEDLGGGGGGGGCRNGKGYGEGISKYPDTIYAITDGGDCNIVHLSVKKALVGFFRNYDMDEVIAIRTAAALSFYNPVERMHARANQGLQGLGLMRTAMLADFEKIMKKCNSNDEVRQACQKEPHLKEALQNSLHTPIQLQKEIFSRLSMSQTEFRILDPASEGELDAFISNYDIFDNGIDNLTSKK